MNQRSYSCFTNTNANKYINQRSTLLLCVIETLRVDSHRDDRIKWNFFFLLRQRWRPKFARGKRKPWRWPGRRYAWRPSWSPWPRSPMMHLGSWSISAWSCWRKRGMETIIIDFTIRLRAHRERGVTNCISARSAAHDRCAKGRTLGGRGRRIDSIPRVVNLTIVLLFHFAMFHLEHWSLLH